MNFQTELSAAMEAARRASDYLQNAYREFIAIPDAPVNISTEADRKSQELILHFLHDQFPNDGLCGEENTALRTTVNGGAAPERWWVVDPIDGTRGFAKKNDQFSVMIALREQQQILVGVVIEPATNRLTYASLGSGCWFQVGDNAPQRCAVTTTNVISKAVLAMSHLKPGVEHRLLNMIPHRQVLETYSAGIKLAMVARGEADCYPNDYAAISDWDLCAGHLLVTEAGGVFTTFRGEPLVYGQPNFCINQPTIASNGLLHEQLLHAVRHWEG
ncbi:MAG: 3'(2'),5'-bisphosphate nucleotidase CysQ [Zavarzinella sp.]